MIFLKVSTVIGMRRGTLMSIGCTGAV